MDFTTVVGIGIGILSIFLGNVLEGGHFSALLQFTAFLIVFGGTLGATVVSNSSDDLKRAMKWFKTVFSDKPKLDFEKSSKQIVEASKLARAESFVAIEKKLSSFDSDFLKSIFRFALEGVEAEQVEEVYYNRIDIEEETDTAASKVWMDAGGFAPTIGIIGAVLGLIHVMGNLSDTSELGKGIAVAFVATVYGVGSANLVFIPLSNKIKSKIKRQRLHKEMIVEGVVAIIQGKNPHFVSEKMQSYVTASKRV